MPATGSAALRRMPRAWVLTLVLAVPRLRAILVRVHWTPYWRVITGTGCVSRRGGWTLLGARAAGTVVLAARASVGRLQDPPACSRAQGAAARS